MKGLFKAKTPSLDLLLKNDLCKKLLDDYCNEDLAKTTSLVIVYEVDGDVKKTYWKCAGLEPAQAILTLDQLHHRVQHEGLAGYD